MSKSDIPANQNTGQIVPTYQELFGSAEYYTVDSERSVLSPAAYFVDLMKLVGNNIQVDPFPYLKEGQRVYVRSGPLKGTEGFLVRKDKHCRLIMSLDVLMQSVSIQVDEACVEPLNK